MTRPLGARFDLRWGRGGGILSYGLYRDMLLVSRPVPILLLCSATLDQLLVLGATFYGSSNCCLCAEVSYFLFCTWKRERPFSTCNKENRRCLQPQPQPQAIFEQNIGLEHVLSMKKSTISKETSIYGKFLNVKRGLSLLVNI